MSGVMTVDSFKIPCPVNDLRIGFSSAGSGFQEEKRLHIDLSTAERLSLFVQRIGRDPNAVLHVAEAPRPEEATQALAFGILPCGHVEDHQAPLSVPRSCPTLLWITSSKGMQASFSRQTIDPIIRRRGIALEQLLFFQRGDLSQEPIA